MRAHRRTGALASALLLVFVSSAHSQTIKHVIVVMEENRSFDHIMLGFANKSLGVDGIDGTQYNVDADGNKVRGVETKLRSFAHPTRRSSTLTLRR